MTLLSQRVCGITPTSPGFRTFRVAPQLGSLREASATVDTHHGLIQVTVKRVGKRMKVSLTVPTGTRAEVILPNGTRRWVEAGTHQVG